MYVSRFDRPWIEPSFLLEGFLVCSQDDIEKLVGLCKFVYVDTDRGESPNPKFILENNNVEQEDINIVGAGRAAIGKKPKPRTNSGMRLPAAENQQDRKRSKDTPVKIDNDRKLSNFNGYHEGVSNRRIHTYTDKTSYSRSLGTSVWCATFGRHLGLERSGIEALSLGGV